MNTPIYLEYAATTPVAPEVVDCMMQYFTADGIFENPSSIQQIVFSGESFHFFVFLSDFLLKNQLKTDSVFQLIIVVIIHYQYLNKICTKALRIPITFRHCFKSSP